MRKASASPIVYAFFTAVVTRENKPTLEAGINGAWLIATVATQSVSVLGSLVAGEFGAAHDVVRFVALAMFLLGGMLYLSIITLIFYRFTFVHLTSEDMTPPYWISMGAVAITTLAGAMLLLRGGDWALLRELRPFVMGNPNGLVHVGGQRLTLEQADLDPTRLPFDVAEHERGRSATQLWEDTIRDLRDLLARDGDAVVVRDLESRNGTQLRGINLAGPIPVRDGLELKLGKEVPLRVRPSERLRDAVEIEVSGLTYYARLGPMTHTPISGLDLVAGADGWIELAAEGVRAFTGDVELVPRATLLVGDSISVRRGSAPVLRVTST